MKFDKSIKICNEAVDVIPMGTSTFSRNPNHFVIGKSPLFIDSAKGCYLTDVDGNTFIDYSMSLCMINLGYSNEEVNNAAKKAIDEGLIYTLSCPEESQLAKRIIKIVPCAEMVRFFKNGSDSCEAAVRIARNYTGRQKILTVAEGYHGFHDWFIASTQRTKGVPKVLSDQVYKCCYNDIDCFEKTVREHKDEIAAVIMEPIIIYEPKEGFLERIRELTNEYGIILIFDEMKTGFRLSIGGGQQYFNVTPDLAVFGKGLANGFPISALAGKKFLMKQFEDENCFMSGSYATEKASISASLKTLEILENKPVIDHIWETATKLKNGINDLIIKYQFEDVMKVAGLPPMLHLIITNQKNANLNQIKSFLQQECVKRGFLYVGYHHTSYAHTEEDIDKTLGIYDEVFGLLKKTLDEGSINQKIEGKPISAFEIRKIKTA